jgi:hypothetical protein
MAWHAVSVALYALCTYLVYRVTHELLHVRLAAGIAALVFAVHPIHIESVCWVSACNELLPGPLVAVSLLNFHKAIRLNAKPFWNRWTLLSLLAWTAALFTEESVLPVVAVFPYLAWRFTMWIVAGFTVGGMALLVWVSQRKDPTIGVAGILLLAPLLPVLIAVKVFLDGETAHDRYLFLPSVGLCLLVGIVVKPMLVMSKAVMALVVVAVLAVVVCFSALTEALEGYYRDEEAYFGRAQEIDPGNVLVMDYLGDSYVRDSRMPEALALFQSASSLAPSRP